MGLVRSRRPFDRIPPSVNSGIRVDVKTFHQGIKTRRQERERGEKRPSGGCSPNAHPCLTSEAPSSRQPSARPPISTRRAAALSHFYILFLLFWRDGEQTPVCVLRKHTHTHTRAGHTDPLQPIVFIGKADAPTHTPP